MFHLMHERNGVLKGHCLTRLKVGAAYHIKRSNKAEGFIKWIPDVEAELSPG
jgi:hypothetical protein